MEHNDTYKSLTFPLHSHIHAHFVFILLLSCSSLCRNHLEKILNGLKKVFQEKKKRVYLAVEGIYANTGELCPLVEIMNLKKRFPFRLILEESFSFGVLGKVYDYSDSYSFSLSFSYTKRSIMHAYVFCQRFFFKIMLDWSRHHGAF